MVIVPVSTTFRGQIKQTEMPFDAGLLRLLNTVTPILLHSLGVGWGVGDCSLTGRDAPSDCEVRADYFSNVVTGAESFNGAAPGVKRKCVKRTLLTRGQHSKATFLNSTEYS